MDLDRIFNEVELQRIKYYMIANRCIPHHIISTIKYGDNNVIKEKIKSGTQIIQMRIDEDQLLLKNIKTMINKGNPYYKYLLDEKQVTIPEVVLFLMLYELDIRRVIGGDIELIPDFVDNKYKIVMLEKGEIFNHEGVLYKHNHYYFSPTLLDYQIVQFNEPTELIKLLSEQNTKNEVWIRLDENLAIPKERYQPDMLMYCEVYRGKILNVEHLDFPYYKNNVILSVYNPKTMKKIQFKLSTRGDGEKWIEVEELFNYSDVKESYITKYLHSIYDSRREKFTHVDGSINFYRNTTYKNRFNTSINSHADGHEKLWLVEGLVNKSEWLKLIYSFFNDEDLISDAFSGNINEKILEEIILN